MYNKDYVFEVVSDVLINGNYCYTDTEFMRVNNNELNEYSYQRIIDVIKAKYEKKNSKAKLDVIIRVINKYTYDSEITAIDKEGTK